MSSLSFPTPAAIVRVEVMGPHFTKYHLNNGQVLHHFTEAADEFFHNHPWGFTTHVLVGGYMEQLAVIQPDGSVAFMTQRREANTSHTVKAKVMHRLTGLLGGDCWTLVEPGPWEQPWGFFRFDERGIWYRDGENGEDFALLA